MQSISLDGVWRLWYGPQADDAPDTPDDLTESNWPVIQARVPGNVELDLMEAGELPDLHVGNNIYATREIETYRWWYRRSFRAPELRPGQRLQLTFEGLDCIATVFVNGDKVGTASNMLIPQQFDISDFVAFNRDNDLAVRLDSAVVEGRKHDHDPIEHAFRSSWEALYVRKAPHMYGWDIMPRLVSAGIWRSVHLDVLPPTRWRSVYFATRSVDVQHRVAQVGVVWDFVTERLDIDGLSVRIRLERDGETAASTQFRTVSTHGVTVVTVKDADLWWPRGMGEPALYQATAELLDENGEVLDRFEANIGLRTVELHYSDINTPDAPGRFQFLVNGEPVFAKGTNWVPLDALHARDRKHLPAVLEMLTDLNCNMVRCWGGNVYEDDLFYDFCDRNGILVWQDFSLACAVYPQTDEFARIMEEEAEAVVRRLRNHPSIALWAGNNENDMAAYWGGCRMDPNTDRISRRVLPEVVRRLDPARPYLPSSPYVSPKAVQTAREHNTGIMNVLPEVHLWRRPWYKDPFYTEPTAPFVSEIGFHGCPDRATIEQMLDPDYIWPWKDNDQWLTKSVRPLRDGNEYTYRIPLMAEKIECMFGQVPDDLDAYIFASQAAQAEAFKFFIERWRSRKWRCTGIVWWNLRDGWPIFSDAVVDYYNRRKLAYFAIRRVMTDLCAIVCEPDADLSHPLVVVNDTRRPASGRVTVADVESGRELFAGDFAVEPNGIVRLAAIPRSEGHAMWRIRLQTADGEFENHYLLGEPPFDLDQVRDWYRRIGLLDARR